MVRRHGQNLGGAVKGEMGAPVNQVRDGLTRARGSALHGRVYLVYVHYTAVRPGI